MKTESVGILGAGITGLTAAWQLRRLGLTVALYEASPRTGGPICSRRDGDWLAEGGPNTILETAPAIATLVDDLGLAPRRQYSDPAAGARFVVRGAQPRELPGSPLRFFLGGMYSASAKLRLLREPLVPRGTVEDEAIADFVRRRLGTEFLEYGIDPLVTGIYAGDPEKLSVRHAFPRIQALEQRYGSLILGQIFGARERKKRGDVAKDRARKFSFDDGLQVLPDTLAASFQGTGILRLGTEVLSLERAGTAWQVELRDRDGRRTVSHDAFLCCGTAGGLARVPVRGLGNDAALAVLNEIRHPPVTSVVLGFRRADVAHPCQGFGALIPHREGFGILGTIFSSSLFPRRAPAGHLTLTTYVGGMRNPDAAALPDGPLLDLVLRELGRLFGVAGKPAFVHLMRWPRAIPQYEVGYGRFKQVFDDLEARGPGLFFAGHLRDGVALSDSIQAGLRSAERIRARLAATPGA